MKQLKTGPSQVEKSCKISSSSPTNSIDLTKIIVFHRPSRTADGKEDGPLSRKTQKFVVYLMLICMLLTTLLAGISMWF